MEHADGLATCLLRRPVRLPRRPYRLLRRPYRLPGPEKDLVRFRALGFCHIFLECPMSQRELFYRQTPD